MLSVQPRAYKRNRKLALRWAFISMSILIVVSPLLFLLPVALPLTGPVAGLSFSAMVLCFFYWTFIFGWKGIKDRDILAPSEYEDIRYKGVGAIIIGLIYIFLSLLILSALVIPIGLLAGWR